MDRTVGRGRPTPMAFLKQWVAGFVVFVAVDVLWIGVVANGFYRRELGPLLRPG